MAVKYIDGKYNVISKSGKVIAGPYQTMEQATRRDMKLKKTNISQIFKQGLSAKATSPTKSIEYKFFKNGEFKKMKSFYKLAQELYPAAGSGIQQHPAVEILKKRPYAVMNRFNGVGGNIFTGMTMIDRILKIKNDVKHGRDMYHTYSDEAVDKATGLEYRNVYDLTGKPLRAEYKQSDGTWSDKIPA